MLEVTDWAPIDLRERVRSVIWLNGTLHEVPRDLERDLAIEIALIRPGPIQGGAVHPYIRRKLGEERAAREVRSARRRESWSL